MLICRLKNIRMQEFMVNKTEFAEMLGIELTQYIKYENAEVYPSLEKAINIAKALNKNIKDIWW